MTDLVTTKLDASVLIVTMNRPAKKNALLPEMYQAMADALRCAEHDETIRCVLITGQADCFTAGNDMGSFLASPHEGQTLEDPVFGFISTIGHATIPVVAAVGGVAVGIGTTMLLHCDLVYAATNARFILPFINLAVVPEAASSMLLPRLAGYQRAAELLMLGEPFGAEYAERFGLVNEVCSPGQVFDRAMKAARRLSEKPPGALRAVKMLMKRGPEAMQDRMDTENKLFEELLLAPEAQEAVNAFLDKRNPDFSQFS